MVPLPSARLDEEENGRRLHPAVGARSLTNRHTAMPSVSALSRGLPKMPEPVDCTTPIDRVASAYHGA